MAKRKRARVPKRAHARHPDMPVRILACFLAAALVVPLCASLFGLVGTGLSRARDALSDMSDDAVALRDLLADSSCPPGAARSIALACQREGWLPALGCYYLPEDGSSGSAVVTTDRHMVSAAVADGRMARIEVTDPYQNASVLEGAGMGPDDAKSAAAWLHAADYGLLSDAARSENGFEVTLPDGRALLSGTSPDWTLDWTYEND